MRPEDLDLDVDPQDVTDIAAVELLHFRATPERIGPFGSSRLDWRVRAPDRPFLFTLNNRSVREQGSQSVSPVRSTGYVLRVSLGRLSRVLGAVRVEVELDDCQEFEFRRIFEQLKDQIVRGVESDPDTVFRRRDLVQPRLPEITEDRGGIRIVLHLRRLIDDRPDPDVTIGMRFGLAIRDGTFVATGTSIRTNVTVPWWVWLIPGSQLAIPPLLNNAEEEAERFAERMVDRLVAFIDVITGGPEGTRKHTARLFVDGTSEVLAVTYCGTGTPPVD